MKILVLNSGSSSVKAKVYKFTRDIKEINAINIDGIGRKKSKIKNHKTAIEQIIKNLIENKTIEHKDEIKITIHRVVHGGENIQPLIINSKNLKTLKKLSHLAPLHNPHNITGIISTQKILPKAMAIAVFDTTFHTTIPKKAALYAVPAYWNLEFGIKKYGFHGNSHNYVSEKITKKLGKKNSRIISCHLGNGSSITAIKNGKSIDTSMGFTPLEGVMMGTRSGTIDPGIIFHMNEINKIPLKKLKKEINEESGLKAISGGYSDMRDIYALSLKKNPRAINAIEMLAYQIAKYCGSFAAVLNGVDALVFTGGIGTNAWYLREKVCAYLEFLGLKLDKRKNRSSAPEIHNPTSKINVFVLPTDEEIIMVKQALKLWKK